MTACLDGITCPECGATSRRVLESRRLPGRVRRRCACAACGARFTSYELRYDEITARIDAAASARASRLLDKFQALERSMAAIRQQLMQELDSEGTKELPDMEAESPTCEHCIQWTGDRCSLGHPDPQDEGIEFARWCASYQEKGSDPTARHMQLVA